MTDTDEREATAASSPSDPHADKTAAGDPRAAHLAGQRAFKELTAPIRGSMMVARVLGFLYGALAVAPYVVLVQLGQVLLAAARSGASPDRAEVMTLLMWLTGAFGVRYGIYFVALAVTHFADVRFGHIVRSRMVSVLAAAPLAWFTSTNSGAVRKAIQDDTHDVHTVIAHAPVESAAAVSAPVSLLIYAFVVDWRLGLLSIATLPLYGLLNAWMMRGMGEKTAQMDRHLSRVSSTMVEFVSGISVVKAFGTRRRGSSVRSRSSPARSSPSSSRRPSRCWGRRPGATRSPGPPRCGSWTSCPLIHCPPRGARCQTDRTLRSMACPSPTGRPSPSTT